MSTEGNVDDYNEQTRGAMKKSFELPDVGITKIVQNIGSMHYQKKHL